jgi:hypothetical protein
MVQTHGHSRLVRIEDFLKIFACIPECYPVYDYPDILAVIELQNVEIGRLSIRDES